jgi:hypothetical protein
VEDVLRTVNWGDKKSGVQICEVCRDYDLRSDATTTRHEHRRMRCPGKTY